MGGGTVRAIAWIKSSGMTPGPLGIEDTSPIASAPASIAVRASSELLMQHTLTRTRITSSGRSDVWRVYGDCSRVNQLWIVIPLRFENPDKIRSTRGDVDGPLVIDDGDVRSAEGSRIGRDS
jgi:hypothetical protein